MSGGGVVTQAVAIALGAALGALLRWQLGVRLNAWFPELPPGTLAANLIGGFVIGAAIATFSAWPGIPAGWRLFLATGFCGGLTTFSTFSAEVFALLQHGRLALALVALALHVGGSLLATAGGFAIVRMLRALA